MSKEAFSWKLVLAYLLAAFFFVGAVGNIAALGTIAADYERWGYPNWFHYITGVLEAFAAVMLVRRASRFFGAVLAACIMIGASSTVLWHAEMLHAVAPLIVLSISCLVGWYWRPSVRN